MYLLAINYIYLCTRFCNLLHAHIIKTSAEANTQWPTREHIGCACMCACVGSTAVEIGTS